jgi:FAD/FMN-containing dehydrogenase/Fe-S oxidoreductase
MFIPPRLPPTTATSGITQSFLRRLKRARFSGGILTDYASRLVMATDNSIYHVLPDAVLQPKNTKDIALIMHISEKSAYSALRFTPKGGGTGTNGQSLSNGICIDCSRYMNQILEINLEEAWVRVQPGVVLDSLNAELNQHGYFFAPSVAPSSRATLGGMIATDACGKGSAVYGRTSQHIIQMEWVSATGKITHSTATSPDTLSDMEKELLTCIKPASALIKAVFPKIPRFSSGYNLAHFIAGNGDININALIAGSEGTLGIVSEAKLKIMLIPKRTHMLVLGYANFHKAIQDGKTISKHHPHAIETLDNKVITASKGDDKYKSIIKLVPELGEEKIGALNIVEFKGDDPDAVKRRLNEAKLESAAIAYYDSTQASKQRLFWQWRASAVGILGKTGTIESAIPFVEDCAVPVDKLDAFITDVEALFKRYELEAAFYGHIDAGCMHVRPIMNLQNPDHQEMIQPISEQMMLLTKKYGGILWGEHGRGYRSGFGPSVFGESLFSVMQAVKYVFDPQNKLNPGKIAPALHSKETLVQVTDNLRAKQDAQVPPSLQYAFQGAFSCNGNGACFQVQYDRAMCPSFKFSQDRIHSPKGRASILREWCRLVAPKSQSCVDPSHWLLRTLRGILKQLGRRDFNHDVYHALDKCLSCNACTHECPVNVDIPTYKAQFLESYYARYLRPLRDHILSNSEAVAPAMAISPRVSNAVTQNILSRTFMRVLGMRDLPTLSVPSIYQELNALAGTGKVTQLNSQTEIIASTPDKKSVFLVLDAVTMSYDAPVVISTIRTLLSLKHKVYILPYLPSGKTKRIKGFIDSFDIQGLTAATQLQAAHSHKLPVFGIEPSIVGQWKTDYIKLRDKYAEKAAGALPDLGTELRLDELLLNTLGAKVKKSKASPPIQYHLFMHCSEQSGAPDAAETWVSLFNARGLDLIIERGGCCGMAGSFGHESRHYKESKGIYHLSWAEKIAGLEPEQILATGFSCREQIKRFSKVQARHPIQVLSQLI